MSSPMRPQLAAATDNDFDFVSATISRTAAKNQPENLWDQAIQTLSDEDKQQIDFGRSDKRAALDEVLAIVEDKKNLCMKRRWKYKKSNGENVILRDVFEKMIKWIEKFKEIGDVAVQYDPAHAALPWAGVRFLLQAAVNDSQTFGAMIEGLEVVSNLITRYAIFENLYLRGASAAKYQLEQSLVRLYATVLVYLSKARRYYDQKTGERLARSIIQTAEASVEAYLHKISEQEEQVDTLARLVDAEYQQNMAEHQLLVKIGLERLSNEIQAVRLNDIDMRYKLGQILCVLKEPIVRVADQLSDLHDNLKRKERLEIFGWISTTPYRLHHQTLSKELLPNSGLWLLRKAEYIEWRKSSVSSILWLHGIPGSGKTRLVSIVIQSILEENSANPSAAPIAYFYCARNEAEPQRAEPDEILRSVLKQLSCSKAELPIRDPVVREYMERKEEAEQDGLEPMRLTVAESVELILALTDSNPAIIIIDALDECHSGRRHELLKALADIIKRSANLVKVFVSSRDDIDIVLRLEDSPNVFISANDNSQDIESFVFSEVERSIMDQRLLNGRVSDELKTSIITTLINGASGMFRWVSLQIQNICDSRRMKVEKDIKDELGRLPETLSELYDLIYEQIVQTGAHGRSIAESALKWLLCAHRPLSAEEFIAAVSVNSEGQSTSLSNIDILNLCCNLVVLDAELGIFRFAHLSVREYLEGRPEYTINETNALALGRCLETYMYNQETLCTVELTAEYHNLLRKYATLYWVVHFQSLDRERRRSALKTRPMNLFFQGHNVSLSFTEWTQDVEKASRSWKWVDPYENRLSEAWSIPSTPLFTACVFGLLEILEGFNTSESTIWNQDNNTGMTALMLAAREGHEDVVRLLLAHESIEPDTKVIMWGQTALSMAAENGHEVVVRILLSREDVNANSKNNTGKTPLSLAAGDGQLQVVKLLLEHKGIKPNAKDMYGQTPLSLAAGEGNVQVVKLLLEREGIELDSKDKHGQTPLSLAAREGNVEVVKLLLEHEGVELDSKDRYGRTPLLWAARKTHVEVVQLLLGQKGVKPDSKDKYGQTPLSWAAKYGHETVVRLLLAHQGVDPDFIDNKGMTPLMLAAYGGHQEVVSLLLADNAVNPEFKDNYGQSPLSWAASAGNVEVVQLLLAHKGVEPDSTDKYGQTPLSWAAKYGNEAVVQLLLANQAVDPDVIDSRGKTPLMLATKKGNQEVVRLLSVRKGIKPDHSQY